MYNIHTTPGFIIGSQPYGEAGKLISIFTRDAGLILASAQGIRLEKSKLRYASQDYSFGEFSFVRGKEFWRLTDAKLNQKSKILDQKCLELSVRIGLLLKRLLNGEEAHPELFDVLEATFDYIQSQSDLDKESLLTLESLTVARLFYQLGYIGNDPELNGYLNEVNISEDLLNVLKDKRMSINKHINKALKESQL